MEHLSPSAACTLDSRWQHRARTNPADGPARIDIQDKWWHMALLMMEVAREWPARA